MKLLIKDYLSGLKERKELDILLPELLSHMGLNVFSSPMRGTRQNGVDVAAVGKLPNESEEKVYLLSIKAGDLTRATWDGEQQSLRPSLNEIVDTYVRNILPVEHNDKQIIICPCFGGEVQESIRESYEAYIRSAQERHQNISFQTWDGDKIAGLIIEHFLNEKLLPKEFQTNFRKSLAFIDDSEISYKHYHLLISELFNTLDKTKIDKKTRKKDEWFLNINLICLGSIFKMAEDSDNLKPAYLAAEISLIYSWQLLKKYESESKNKKNENLYNLFLQMICKAIEIFNRFANKVSGFTEHRYGLSIKANANNYIDLNQSLFELLSFMSRSALLYWIVNDIKSFKEIEIIDIIIQLNPALKLPVSEYQTNTIALTLYLFLISNPIYAREYLNSIIMQLEDSHKFKNYYPITTNQYSDLIQARPKDESEKAKLNYASYLIPTLALVAAILNDAEAYSKVQNIAKEYYAGCNFQLWFYDELSDNCLNASDNHGYALMDLPLGTADITIEKFLEIVLNEMNVNLSTKLSYHLYPMNIMLLILKLQHFNHPFPTDFFLHAIDLKHCKFIESLATGLSKVH